VTVPTAAAATRFAAPQSYTPKHLAEKILTSRATLEGERKQVTVLFADLKGSMELLADRDPEEARKLLDPVLERMMEAVHRYEGTVQGSRVSRPTFASQNAIARSPVSRANSTQLQYV
jgi:class 3 adenylate cyclase